MRKQPFKVISRIFLDFKYLYLIILTFVHNKFILRSWDSNFCFVVVSQNIIFSPLLKTLIYIILYIIFVYYFYNCFSCLVR